VRRASCAEARRACGNVRLTARRLGSDDATRNGAHARGVWAAHAPPPETPGAARSAATRVRGTRRQQERRRSPQRRCHPSSLAVLPRQKPRCWHPRRRAARRATGGAGSLRCVCARPPAARAAASGRAGARRPSGRAAARLAHSQQGQPRRRHAAVGTRTPRAAARWRPAGGTPARRPPPAAPSPQPGPAKSAGCGLHTHSPPRQHATWQRRITIRSRRRPRAGRAACSASPRQRGLGAPRALGRTSKHAGDESE
jgi:hypothetical protein